MKNPIYVISKGRSDRCLTANALLKDGVPFHIVIEPQEFDLYSKHFDKKLLYILPFSNLGLGSIPARNWVWEHALSTGAKRHWILDDNIRTFFRRWRAKRIYCSAKIALEVAEEFFNRYENIAVGGLNYKMFAPDHKPLDPFFLNVHVYSCISILNKVPYRWRGRYNEDTDLCLQVLSGGWCTVLLNSFLADKMPTMTMKGGNTDQLYKADGRLTMAKSLERLWPKVVTTKRRFQRPQHVIKDSWKRFDTPLKLRSDLDLNTLKSDFTFKLVQTKPIKSNNIKMLFNEFNKSTD